MREYLDKVLEIFATIIISLMIITSSWQVLSRYVLKSPSTFTEEFLRFSLIWISMLGIAYVAGKSKHVAIDFLKEKFTKKEQKILEIIIQIVYFLFALIIMVIGGFRAVSISMEQISPALRIPMGYIYISIPISGIFTMIYSIVNILEIKKREGECK